MIRRCFRCDHKDGHGPLKVPLRIFLTPEEPNYVPKCPDGHGPMQPDTNGAYNLKALIAESKATLERHGKKT